MPLRGLIFDFDGLLVDTEQAAYEAWREQYLKHGVDLPLSEWVFCIGGFGGEFHSCDHLVASVGREVDRESVRVARAHRKKALIEDLPLKDGAQDLLIEAKALGLRIGLASSSGYAYVSEILSRLGVLQLFDHFATGNEVLNAKPAADVYLLALEKLGVAPEDAVAIEDSPNGAIAATAAGIHCVVVPNAITQMLVFPPNTPLFSSLLDLSMTYLHGATR
jgi:HAD superfamily hydrolase (TIGR01509 family)